MEHLIDSDFKFVKDTDINNNDKLISGNWRVKTRNGSNHAIATKVEDGLRLDISYPEDTGYVYIRQLIQDVKRFSGKRFKLTTTLTRGSWQPLKYDVYVTARFSHRDDDRVAVCDTPQYDLLEGRQTLVNTFTVPNITSYETEEFNALSVAFRLVKDTEPNTLCIIHSMKLEEI